MFTTEAAIQDQLHVNLESMWNTIKVTAATCRKTSADAVHRNSNFEYIRPRWAKILDSKDPKLIWKALNWKGTFDDISENQPSENLFKNHFEHLLNQEEGILENPVNIDDAPYMPVLDDPFEINEYDSALKSIN